MRNLLFALLALPLIAACQPQTPPAASPSPSAPAASQGGAVETTAQERAGVLASIQGFMDALRMRDTTAMYQHMDSLTHITLLRPAREGGTRVVVMTGRQFVAAVTRPGEPGIDEPIRNPAVHVSGDLATVWAEYQVRRDGAVSHCGFDAFHLVRRNGRWMLLTIADTFQTTGCGPAWPQ